MTVDEIGQRGGDLEMLAASAQDTRLLVVYGYARLVGYDRDLNLVPDILRDSNVTFDYDVVNLLRKDSLEMTEADRRLIRDAVCASDVPRIVVTHGTDTMVETAAAIARGVESKTIVLTGAMIPYAFGSSDGLFNLGSALSFAQALPSGVYIAMNGQSFAWDQVRKNPATGVFEALT